MTVAAITMSVLMGSQTVSAGPMDKYVEQSLVKVCRSAMTNNLLKYHKTLKSFHYTQRMIAERVVCNGDEIADFARKHGSYKVAHKIEKSKRSSTSITDIAAVNKLSVTFEE